MRATATWMRIAFSEAPRNFLILKGLFDPAEEQLDIPTALVETGDFLGAGIEIVRKNSKYFARIDNNPDFADRIAKGILAVFCLAGGQKSDAIRKDRAAFHDSSLFDLLKRRVGFEPGYDPASSRIELGPPAIIVIAEVEHVASRQPR